MCEKVLHLRPVSNIQVLTDVISVLSHEASSAAAFAEPLLCVTIQASSVPKEHMSSA